MPKFAANLTMLFNEVPFLDRFAAAAEAGFSAVEFLFPYPYAKDELAERLDANRLRLVLHNLPAGHWDQGERGIACLPDRIGEFQDGVGRAIDYARALKVPQLNCLVGIAPASVGRPAARRRLRIEPPPPPAGRCPRQTRGSRSTSAQQFGVSYRRTRSRRRLTP